MNQNKMGKLTRNVGSFESKTDGNKIFTKLLSGNFSYTKHSNRSLCRNKGMLAVYLELIYCGS